MKNIKWIALLLNLAVVFMCVNNTHAQNSSGWRGDQGDGIVTGFVVPDHWPDHLNQDWQVKVGEGDASPVLLNGRIYVFVKADNAETVVCLDAEKGTELWRSALNSAPEVTGPASSHPGPRSTPFVSENRMYTLGAGGTFTCLNTKTGKVMWKNDSYTEVPQFFTSCSPLLTGDVCVVQLGGRENGVVVAFNAQNGEEEWKIEGLPCTYSSPVIMKTFDKTLLIQSETDLHGVSLDGKKLWKIPTPVERRSYNVPTPVYQENMVIVAGQGIGTKAYGISNTGAEWKFKELWSNSDLGTSFNTPMIKGDFLYANEARLGKLFCLNMKNGEKCWMDETTQNRFASIQDLGKALVSLPANGKLIVFEANGKAFTEIKQYQVADTDVYAHPVFNGNKIYVKDKEMLTCWSVK